MLPLSQAEASLLDKRTEVMDLQLAVRKSVQVVSDIESPVNEIIITDLIHRCPVWNMRHTAPVFEIIP